MSAQNIALIIGVLLILIFSSYFIGIYNKLVMLKNNVEKAFMNIDVILMQRAAEIPELVKIASKFMEHETTLLTKLTNLRTDFLNAKSINDKVENSMEFSSAMKSLFAVSENYPALLSNNNFLELQKRVSQMEDKIADRREFFNDSVNLYNIGIQEFPAVLFSKILGYKSKSLFIVSPEDKAYNGVQL
ncbi:LemA family protein [Pedobacter changchengzhani]|uniref:LemA family protein n=1 Tax=Pedobacter changchengzhani TaxID=2529274 RepID=A0A4R5MIT7_9SPHI|nr:LemA family protein [Pedobacter changchengzhani]TDG35065.1 LemA family protein [Pedobacter changchengzhani]